MAETDTEQNTKQQRQLLLVLQNVWSSVPVDVSKEGIILPAGGALLFVTAFQDNFVNKPAGL